MHAHLHHGAKDFLQPLSFRLPDMLHNRKKPSPVPNTTYPVRSLQGVGVVNHKIQEKHCSKLCRRTCALHYCGKLLYLGDLVPTAQSRVIQKRKADWAGTVDKGGHVHFADYANQQFDYKSFDHFQATMLRWHGTA